MVINIFYKERIGGIMERLKNIRTESETDNKENKEKKVLSEVIKFLFKIRWDIKLVVMVILTIVSLVLLLQNKLTDAENMKLNNKMEDMKKSMKVLETKLDAAEQKRYERVETETVQVMKQLLAVSDLTTYTYEYANEITESSTRMLPFLGWDIPGTANKVTIQYSGVINIGYDISKMKYDLSHDEKKIYVTVPEPEVLDNYIKFDDLVCICEDNILNPIKTDTVMTYFKGIENIELAKAEAENIYEKANEQLKQTVKGYFAVFPEYDVVFR